MSGGLGVLSEELCLVTCLSNTLFTLFSSFICTDQGVRHFKINSYTFVTNYFFLNPSKSNIDSEIFFPVQETRTDNLTVFFYLLTQQRRLHFVSLLCDNLYGLAPLSDRGMCLVGHSIWCPRVCAHVCNSACILYVHACMCPSWPVCGQVPVD